jgi:hypothetical protein
MGGQEGRVQQPYAYPDKSYKDLILSAGKYYPRFSCPFSNMKLGTCCVETSLPGLMVSG